MGALIIILIVSEERHKQDTVISLSNFSIKFRLKCQRKTGSFLPRIKWAERKVAELELRKAGNFL
jgi:hypothetical protein